MRIAIDAMGGDFAPQSIVEGAILASKELPSDAELVLVGEENRVHQILDSFDYSKDKEWKFKGNQPAIIDFYADWCGPCKMIAPVLEELSEERKDVTMYKVDIEVEQELSAIFQIRSIPSMLFIPMEGQPMMQAGALPKNVLENIIDKELTPSNN